MLTFIALIGCILLTYPLLWMGVDTLLLHSTWVRKRFVEYVIKQTRAWYEVHQVSTPNGDTYDSIHNARLAYRRQQWDPERYQKWALYILESLLTYDTSPIRYITLIDCDKRSYINVCDKGSLVLKLDTTLFDNEAWRLINTTWLGGVSCLLVILLMFHLMS